MLVGLEAEIKKVKNESEMRAKQEARAERQVKAVTEDVEKGGSSGKMPPLAPSRTGHNTRNAFKRDGANDDYSDDEDVMDVDSGTASKKKGSGKGFFSKR